MGLGLGRALLLGVLGSPEENSIGDVVVLSLVGGSSDAEVEEEGVDSKGFGSGRNQ
jgi:hypothetical protein